MQVAVLGSGQLARMLYLEGIPLGIDVVAVDVANHQVINPVTKSLFTYSVEECFSLCDVITAEFEHIPEALLNLAERSGKLKPSATAIRLGADRIKEKSMLDVLGINNAAYRVICDLTQLDQAVSELGANLVIKASREGYDGYGQWRLTSVDNLPSLKQELANHNLNDMPLIAEKCIPFSRELSILGVRSVTGEVAIYPLTENDHHQGQLHVSYAPVDVTERQIEQAKQAFTQLAEATDYYGVLAIEFFEHEGELLVNEVAPRVHNSGHWTLNGCRCSQFENHLRAIIGLPLGDTSSMGYTAMVNVIGYDTNSQELNQFEGANLHWYAKEARAKRKLAHININADTPEALASIISNMQNQLPSEYFPKLEAAIARVKAL